MKNERNAWIYTRIDAPEDVHNALGGQEKELCEYSEALGYLVAGVSSDLGGGLSTDRPGLHRMVEAVSGRRVQAVLVMDMATLARNAAIAHSLLTRFEVNGVEVLSPKHGRLTLQSEAHGLLKQHLETTTGGQ